MTTETLNSINIRLAEPSDTLAIYQLVDSYTDGVPMDRNRVKNNLLDMVYAKGIVLAEYDNQIIGGVAGYAMPCMFRDEMMFSVMFFYIKKEFRYLTKRLIKEFELILLPTKNSCLSFGVMADQPKLARFMRMMGYKPLETHYYRRF